MNSLGVQLGGLDPREKLEIELRLDGSGRILVLAPNTMTWFDTDVEGVRHLLLMLENLLEDFDKITLGFDRLQDAVDTEPL